MLIARLKILGCYATMVDQLNLTPATRLGSSRGLFIQPRMLPMVDTLLTMSRDFEDEEHRIFFNLDLEPGEGPVVSRAAFMLHSHAMVESATSASPGFIPDEYLEAIAAETDLTAAELCLAGLWERTDGGYSVLDPMMDEAVKMNERMVLRSLECDAHGHHMWVEEGGITYCSHCGTSGSE